MKRLPAFTLSALKSPKEPIRTTIFKDTDAVILSQTQKHAKVIAEAMARYVYGIEEQGEIFADTLQVDQQLLKSYMQLKSALHNNDLKNAFEKHLKNVKLMYDKPDVREPDFMLYEGQEAHLNVYHVKPAVFYLASVYFITQYFPAFYNMICRMTRSQVLSNNNTNSSDRSKSKLN